MILRRLLPGDPLRSFSVLAALIAGLGACGGSAPDPPGVTAAQRVAGADGSPNLIVVLADTLRAASLPFYGYPRDNAPFLSRVAEEGLVFEHHLAHFPATPVSVSQIHTGRLMSPLLMGYDYHLAPVRAIEDDLLILPRVLREAGYSTTLISTHPWFNRSARLLDYFDDVRLHGDGELFKAYAPLGEMTPDVLETLERLGSEPRPFFLYLHTLDPHWPRRVHPGFDRFEGDESWPEAYNSYDSEILYSDYWLGRIDAKLDELGLRDRTVFVFTSDHGEDLGELGDEWWNEGHGATVRRSILHVPLLIRWPGLPELRGRRTDLTRQVDLAPTLLRLLLPEMALDRFRFDGRDLLDPREPPSRESFSFSGRYWGLHRVGMETYYDTWEDRSETVRPVADERNYPRPVAMEPSGDGDASAQHLRRVRRARLAEFDRMAPSYEKLGHALIGIPTHPAGSGPAPTFHLNRMDSRWTLGFRKRLWSGPGERVDPIVLSTPWAPGKYRVAVQLGLGGGLHYRFRIQVVGADNPELEVHARDQDEDGWIDLGPQQIGDPLMVKIWEPWGGASLSAFRLELLEAPNGEGEVDRPEDDEELKDRLRALGYVG